MTEQPPVELYLHIPFCARKCNYCDFYSFAAGEAEFQNYTDRICAAIAYYFGGPGGLIGRPVSSVYFGGGTPTVLGAVRLAEILEAARASAPFLPDAEITAETNPGVETDFAALRRAGFNRLSVGLQSAEPDELTALGRIHTPADAEETFRRARAAGFENLSLDVMLGIPYQTEESLCRTLDFCGRLAPEHISAYLLKIEDGTPLAASPLRARCADPDGAAALYEFAAERLAALGYQRYEISNFAKPGFESRHNLGYWLGAEYLGLGPSAHSLIGGRRFYFDRSYRDFMEKDFSESELEEGGLTPRALKAQGSPSGRLRQPAAKGRKAPDAQSSHPGRLRQPAAKGRKAPDAQSSLPGRLRQPAAKGRKAPDARGSLSGFSGPPKTIDNPSAGLPAEDPSAPIPVGGVPSADILVGGVPSADIPVGGVPSAPIPVGGVPSAPIPVGGWEEFAMLRLRLERGLSLAELSKRFPAPAPAGPPPPAEIAGRAARLAAHGLCVCEGGVVRLTTKGFLLSNPVTAELLYGDE